MRILISVLAMLVVGLFATQAKADLVDDLRNGRITQLKYYFV